MAKTNYKGRLFDSDLEVKYYQYLEENKDVEEFEYHPSTPIKITNNNTYTPDFIVCYKDGHIEIVETKGYNQFSFMRDNMIHNVMLGKTEFELQNWLIENDYKKDVIVNAKVIYKKIKFLQAFGFVDWEFKNPNTLANKRKEKINELEEENKILKKKVKDYERYFEYKFKDKLTKKQKEWLDAFLEEMEYGFKTKI